MRIRSSIIVIILLMIKSVMVNGQGGSMEQTTIFGSRVRNAVTLDVRTDDNNIYFNVINKSYFPYTFEIKFGDFRNLSPREFFKKTTLQPGNNRLFNFKIVDPQEAPVLSYETKYYMAKSNAGEEKFSPYLIPISKNKTVEFQKINNNGSTEIYLNYFVMNTGDTVYCSRKGRVTAVPDNSNDIDRIISGNSLEIRHDDGTIAVYIGLNQIVKIGQDVYPGQPVGIISVSKLLKFSIFEILDEGQIKSIDILYSADDNKMIPSQNLMGVKVAHSDEVIRKEMSKKEISKYEKHSLYNN
jgi:hypothetical protein